MAEAVMLSPTFPPGGGSLMQPIAVMGMPGFDNRRKSGVRKTVDYHSSVVRYLEDRIWQRDSRDRPTIQPDSSYFGQVTLPVATQESPVNSVTTKFVRASTNKVRSPIFCTSWVPDGRRLVTGAASGEFTLWNGTSFNFESILQAHDCPVRSMSWSHSGKWMVTTDDRGFAKYWQTNFNNVHTFQAHNEAVRASSFSPLDTKLATCSDDGTVRIWDFIRCAEEHLLRGHGADVKCLDWHPRKSLLVSGSKDNQQPVALWDPKTGQNVCTLHAHKATVMDVKWNRNGNWLVTAARDNLIKLFDIRVMKEFFVLKGHRNEVNAIAWHPVHENLFASGGSDGAILFWNVGSQKEIGGMEQAHEGFIWSLSWHPLGHILCSGSNDHTSKFWCRNRPGEELKDKYNTFSSSVSFGEDMGIGYSLPGMGAGYGHGSGAVLLPPPSRSHHMGSSIIPPPSVWQASGPFQKREEGAPSSAAAAGNVAAPLPRQDVQVLGADIIAETFAGKAAAPEVKPEMNHLPPQPHVHQNGPLPMKSLGDEYAPDKFSHPPAQSNANGSFPVNPQGPPPPRPPMMDPPRPPFAQADVRGPRPPGPGMGPEQGAPQFRGPGEFRPRFPPDEGSRGFGSRFSWHNPDFHGRRSSVDDDRDFRWQQPHQQQNPYVYRRPSEEFDQRDSRLSSGDAQRRHPDTEEQRPPPARGPPSQGIPPQGPPPQGHPPQGHLHQGPPSGSSMQGPLHPPPRRPDEQFTDQRGGHPHHHGSGQMRDFPENFGEPENLPPGRPNQPHPHGPPPPQHPHPDGPMQPFSKGGPRRPPFPQPGRDQGPPPPPAVHPQHQHPPHPGSGPVRQFPEGGGPGRPFPAGRGAGRHFPEGAGPGRQFPEESEHGRQFPEQPGSGPHFPQEGGPRRQFPEGGGPGRQFPEGRGPGRQFPNGGGPGRQFPEGGRSGRSNFPQSGEEQGPGVERSLPVDRPHNPHPGERSAMSFSDRGHGRPNFPPDGDQSRPVDHRQRPFPDSRPVGGRGNFPPGDQGQPQHSPRHHPGDHQFSEGRPAGPNFIPPGGEEGPHSGHHPSQRLHPSERQFPERVPGGRPGFPPPGGDQALPRSHLQHGQHPPRPGDGGGGQFPEGGAGQFPEGGGLGRPDFATLEGEREPRHWQQDQQIPTNQPPPPPPPPRWQGDRQEPHGRHPDSESFHTGPGDEREFRPERRDFHPDRPRPQHGFNQGPTGQQQSLRDPRLGSGNRPGGHPPIPPQDQQQFFEHPQQNFERGHPPGPDKGRRQDFDHHSPSQDEYRDPHDHMRHPPGRGPPHHGPPHHPPHHGDHGPQPGRGPREHFDHPQQQFERGPPMPDSARRPGFDQPTPPQEEYTDQVHDRPNHGPPTSGRGPPGMPHSRGAQHHFGQSGPLRPPGSSGPPQRMPHSSGPPHGQHQQGFFHAGDARQPPGPPRGHDEGEHYDNHPPPPDQEFRGQFHRHPPPGEQHPADPRMQRGHPNPQGRPESGYQQHHTQQPPQRNPDVQLHHSTGGPGNDPYFHQQPERPHSQQQQQQQHGFHGSESARPPGGMGFHNQLGPPSDHRNEAPHRSVEDPRFERGSGGQWQGGQGTGGRGVGQSFRDPRERREREPRETDQQHDEHDKRERSKPRGNVGDLDRDPGRGRERRGRVESDRLLSSPSRRKSDDRDIPPPPKRVKKDSDREKSRGLPRKK